MYHEFLGSASFWLYLWAVDEDLAAETRNKGCPCGGRLHCANYPRKPMSGSLCCDSQSAVSFKTL
jgi:hypothetical protein